MLAVVIVTFVESYTQSYGDNSRQWIRCCSVMTSVYVSCTGGIRGDDRAGRDLEIIPDPKFRRLKATIDIALAVKLYYTSQ